MPESFTFVNNRSSLRRRFSERSLRCIRKQQVSKRKYTILAVNRLKNRFEKVTCDKGLKFSELRRHRDLGPVYRIKFCFQKNIIATYLTQIFEQHFLCQTFICTHKKVPFFKDFMEEIFFIDYY